MWRAPGGVRGIFLKYGEWTDVYRLLLISILGVLLRPEELQRRSDPYPFWLSCRAAAGVLNIGRQTANNGLLRLQHDGILERVHEGSRGRAAEYV